MAIPTPPNAPPYGRLLRFWRTTYGYSQEALSAAVGVSARHLSFLENGRSNPGRQLVLDIACVFELPHRDQNNMLVAAGFSPLSSGAISEREEHFRNKSLGLMLRSLDPNPTCVADACGNIKMVNRAWVYLHQANDTGFHHGTLNNSYLAWLSNDGLRPMMKGWENLACALLMNLQQEVLLTNDAEAQAIIDKILLLDGIPEDWRKIGAEMGFNHSFRLRSKIAESESITFIVVNHTVGVTPYVQTPRLIVTSMQALNPEALPSREELAGLEHPLLAPGV